jgi:hypothetical protein
MYRKMKTLNCVRIIIVMLPAFLQVHLFDVTEICFQHVARKAFIIICVLFSSLASSSRAAPEA